MLPIGQTNKQVSEPTDSIELTADFPGILQLSGFSSFKFKPNIRITKILKLSEYLTDIENMFNYSNKLINSISIDLPLVSSFNGLFNGCSMLSSLTITHNSDELYYFDNVFTNCNSLNDTTLQMVNIPKTILTINQTFKNTNITVITNKIIHDELIEAKAAFANCLSLTDLTVQCPKNITDASEMFKNCYNLSADISEFFNLISDNNEQIYKSKRINLTETFANCSNVIGTLYGEHLWNHENVKYIFDLPNYCFRNCTKLLETNMFIPILWGGHNTYMIPDNITILELTIPQPNGLKDRMTHTFKNVKPESLTVNDTSIDYSIKIVWDWQLPTGTISNDYWNEIFENVENENFKLYPITKHIICENNAGSGDVTLSTFIAAKIFNDTVTENSSINRPELSEIVLKNSIDNIGKLNTYDTYYSQNYTVYCLDPDNIFDNFENIELSHTYTKAGKYYVLLSGVSEFKSIQNSKISNILHLSNKLTTFNSLFRNSIYLTDIKYAPITISKNIIDCSYMFENCTNLTDFPYSLKMQHAKLYEQMFANCTSLSANINDFVNNYDNQIMSGAILIDRQNDYFEYLYPSIKGMFKNCHNLKGYVEPSIFWFNQNNWHYDKYTFQKCYNLDNYLDIPSLWSNISKYPNIDISENDTIIKIRISKSNPTFTVNVTKIYDEQPLELEPYVYSKYVKITRLG